MKANSRFSMLVSALVLALATQTGCDDEVPATDGGPDGGADGDVDGDADGDADEESEPVCESDDECLDSIYCNGEERCEPTDDDADDLGCVAGEPIDCDDGVASTTDTCSEERGACVHECPDVDGDGHGDVLCVDTDGDPIGDDCDDADPDRYPGNAEICDLESHDEDCDPGTHGVRDEDGDGFIDAACCNENHDGGDPICEDDCDDGNPDVNPDATEVCDIDAVDEDCDGSVNEDLTVSCFPDSDDDGFAVALATASDVCPAPGRDDVGGCPTGTTDRAPESAELTDCAEGDPAIHPGADEACDGVDTDCDGELSALPGVLDETDRDGDGFLECAADPSTRDCADDDARAHPGATEFRATPITVIDVPVSRRFDFDCNGIEEMETTSHGYCNPLSACSTTEGWLSLDPPACGESAEWIEGCHSAFPVCVPETRSRTAACR